MHRTGHDGGVVENLWGGRVQTVRRAGNAVVRSAPARSAFVHRLLGHFAAQGWDGAPRVLGVDGDDEILSFMDGEVPWQQPIPSWAITDDALLALAALVRDVHDLTAGTPLAGDGEVVCHHDLSPSNTVYRGTSGELLPVAFIDWDIAGPGRRIEDVAHVCWQWLDLGPGVTDITEARRKLTLICDAYGLASRDQLLPTIVWWQDRCWRGIEAGAGQGFPPMARLMRDGISDGIRLAEDWTRAHAAELAPPMT